MTDPTTSNPGYSAVLAAAGTTNPAVTVTSTTVHGYVAAPSASTSPYAPLWSYGGSAVLTGSAAVSTGIDLTRVSRSPYVPQFDIQTPAQQTSLPATLPATLNLGTPGASTPSVYYYGGNLSIGAGKTINITGPVILYIDGYLRCNTGTLNITSTGSAEIHFSYLRVYAGSGGIINLTKDPKKIGPDRRYRDHYDQLPDRTSHSV